MEITVKYIPTGIKFVILVKNLYMSELCSKYKNSEGLFYGG